MADINIKNFIKNIELLKEGTKISSSNQFAQIYDQNNDNIFQQAELEALKQDLENSAGSDQELTNQEAIEYLRNKYKIFGNISAEKLNNAKNHILDSINSLIANDIANKMHKVIENNFQWASLSSKDFKNAFDRINSSNVIQVLEAYRQNSEAGESLPLAIIRESSNSQEKIRETLDKLFENIVKNIDNKKYDTSAIIHAWNNLKTSPGTSDEENIDKLFSTMIAMAKGETNIESTESDTVKNITERNEQASNLKNYQVDTQGYVSRALDNIAGVFNNLTQEEVEAIIAKQAENEKVLDSLKNNPEEFAKKFKEIYGIEYSKTAVANYEKEHQIYTNAREKYDNYSILSETFKDVLDVTDLHWSPGKHKTAHQLQKIYDEAYDNLCKMFKKEVIDNILAQHDIGNPPQTWRKYEVLRPIIVDLVKASEEAWEETSGGKSIEQFENEHKSAYHAAYGLKNDSLLEAQDWIMAQQKRLGIAQVGGQVLGAALSFVSGPIALLGAAIIMVDPVQLTENSTDKNGMTKEDWSNYWDTRAETLGWMALGGAVGGVAKVAKSATATNMLKLKGLSQFANASGKSLDDIIKAANLPDEALATLKSVRNLSSVTGFTTEVSLDLITTAMLQKEGVAKGDWIMTLAGALGGSGLLKNCKTIDAAQAKLKSALPEFNWSKADTEKLLGKIRTWAESSPDVMYCALLPTPVAKGMIKGAFKLSDMLSSFFSTIQRRFADKNPKMIDAIEKSLAQVSNEIIEKGYASKDMIDENALKPIADEFGVDCKTLCAQVRDCVKNDKNWLATVGPSLLTATADRAFNNPKKIEAYANTVERFKKKINPESANITTKTAAEVQAESKPVEPVAKVEAETTAKPGVEETATPVKEEFKITDELWAKYDKEVNTAYYETETRTKIVKLMEDYETQIKNGEINPAGFDKTEIYQLMNEYNIHEYDMDTVLPLIKERFHQAFITKELEIKALKQQYPTLSEETIKNTQALIDKLEAKMNKKEKITESELEDLLYETNNNDFAWDDMKKLLYNDSRISNWLNDCTHKDVLTNPKYRGEEFYYEDVNFDEALKWFDEILDKVNNGEKLSLKMIEDTYKGLDTNGNSKMQYSCSDELLIDIIQNHWLLGPMYKELV